MRQILLLGLWPLATVTTLSISILLYFILPLNTLHTTAMKTPKNVELHTGYQLYTAMPSNDNVLGESVTVTDARIEILKQFLTKYKSPLLPHAKKLVETADKYNLDFRLLPAVAMQESTLCRTIPENSFNCWGYGIYGDKIMRFTSYEEAIERVGKGLSSDYVYDGLTTPELIMSRYTPSSNGSWAASVRQFMEEME